METLIVYCKINVHHKINELKEKKAIKDGEEESNLFEINAGDLEKELCTNTKLIAMTSGREDGESSGSDSEPSADNLEEDEMA